MMPTWDEAMTTGVAELDADHRRIAELFDDILLSLNREQNSASLSALLSELVDVMCEHIAREGDLMSSIHYQNAGPHLAGHDEYFNRLSQLVVDCQRHSQDVAANVLKLQKIWKFNHLTQWDQPLAQAILALRD